eukprot:TRINITY_DN8217_c0_g1_i2.p1 TRINITY_DN8217_c0_g1~~TRINITY_DN8217_c0_g1_i2.p1  ORF type:complete len:298 (-),score=80.77 TRINITY_DN8217_c0_g1_i2:144-1037(-)
MCYKLSRNNKKYLATWQKSTLPLTLRGKDVPSKDRYSPEDEDYDVDADYKVEDEPGPEAPGDDLQYDELQDNDGDVEELPGDKKSREEEQKDKFKDRDNDKAATEISSLVKEIEDLDIELSNLLENYKNAKENRAVQVEIERAVNNALASSTLSMPSRWTTESYQVKEEYRRSPPRESPLREANAEPQYRELETYPKSYHKKWEQPESNVKEEWSYERSMEKFLKANPTSAGAGDSYRGREDYMVSSYSQRSREGYKPALRGSVGVDMPTKPYHYKGGYCANAKRFILHICCDTRIV